MPRNFRAIEWIFTPLRHPARTNRPLPQPCLPASPSTPPHYHEQFSRAQLTAHSRFNQHVLIDQTPMPSDVPPVTEIGATSAPLLSAAYFIGARCRDYNDDYMQCKTEAYGRGELECMKEGRKVTRCAASVYVAHGTCGVCSGGRSSPARRAHEDNAANGRAPQDPRHQYPLPEGVPETLGLPRTSEPPALAMSTARTTTEQMRL